MVITYLLFFSASILFLKWYMSKRKYFRMANSFPGPKALFLLGNTLELSTNAMETFQKFRNYAREYCTTYRFWAAHKLTFHLITPEDVEKLLTSNTNITKSFGYKFLHPWLNTGLLVSTGAKWQKRRKILTPTFHFSVLQKFEKIIVENSENFVKELEVECTKEESDVIPLIQQCALKIICETAMGTKMDRSVKKHAEYFTAVHSVCRLIVERFMLPWLYFDFIFKFSSRKMMQDKMLKVLKDFTKKVIHEREVNFLKDNNEKFSTDEEISGKKRMAMLDLLLKEKFENKSIDDDGILEEVDTFMFEGHDTIAMALCYQIVLLAYHKDVQDKIVDEIQDVIGDKTTISIADMNQLQYLEMVIKECLRLYPSVVSISREITQELKLTTGVLPVGSTGVVHIYDLHRDPRHFSDPEKFNPDRFLPENSKNRHPFAYIPFSAGPRNCIGQKFAMLEMKTILYHLLKNYSLESVRKLENLQVSSDIVLRHNGPLYVKFSHRKPLL